MNQRRSHSAPGHRIGPVGLVGLVGLVGVALLVAVVVAAFVVSVVARRGDDGGTASPTSSASPTTPAPAGTIAGTGYLYDLPGDDWTDAYDEATADHADSAFDSIIVQGPSLEEAGSNIAVEVLPAGDATDVDELAEQWRDNLSGTDGAVPDPVTDRTIDGARAVGVTFSDRTNHDGMAIDQVCYLVLRGGNQYSISLSYSADDDTTSQDRFGEVLDSWTWVA